MTHCVWRGTARRSSMKFGVWEESSISSRARWYWGVWRFPRTGSVISRWDSTDFEDTSASPTLSDGNIISRSWVSACAVCSISRALACTRRLLSSGPILSLSGAVLAISKSMLASKQATTSHRRANSARLKGEERKRMEKWEGKSIKLG